MEERLRIIKARIFLDSLTLRRQPEEGESLDLVAKSFAYALEGIPTHHLDECFRRAIVLKTDDFPLTAAAVNRAYQDMMPELQARAETHSAMQEYLLRSGQGSFGLMGLVEFKERHNLPASWRLGDPYPPESDLAGKEVPSAILAYSCPTCMDAGWLASHRPLQGSRLVKCPDCGWQE